MLKGSIRNLLCLLICIFMGAAHATTYDSSYLRPVSTTPNISIFDTTILQLAAGVDSSFIPQCPTGQTIINQWFLPDTAGSSTGNSYFACLYVYNPVNTTVQAYLANLGSGFVPCQQIAGQQQGNFCTTRWVSPPITNFQTDSCAAGMCETNAEFYYFYEVNSGNINNWVGTANCPTTGQSGSCSIQGQGRGPGDVAWNNNGQSSSDDGSHIASFSATNIPPGYYFVYVHIWRSGGWEEMCPSTGTTGNKYGMDYSKTVYIGQSDYGKTCYFSCSGAPTTEKTSGSPAHYHYPNINMYCH